MGVKLWDYCLNDIGPTTPMVRYPVPMDMHTLVLNLMQVYRDDNHTFDDWSGYIEAITAAVKLTAYDTIKHHRRWPKQVPNFRLFIKYLSGIMLCFLIDNYLPRRSFSRCDMAICLASNVFVQDIVLENLPETDIESQQLLRECLFRPSVSLEFEPFEAPNYDMVVPYDFITEDYINELARGIALYTGGDKPAKGMWYAG